MKTVKKLFAGVLASVLLLLGSGCASVGNNFDASKIDVEGIARTGAETTAALVVADNPGRADQLLAIADQLKAVFGTGEVTDDMIADLALRLGSRLGLDPSESVVLATGVRGLWRSIKPAFGDGPIFATDPRFVLAIDAFGDGIRQAVADFRKAQALSGG